MEQKKIVVGFSTFEFIKTDLDRLTDRQKYEYFLETATAISYDNVNDFFDELNLGYVDTENYFWYLINVQMY